MSKEFLSNITANPLSTVASYYAGCLAAVANAMAFVKDELHLTTEEATAKQIGFADRTLGKQIPQRRIKAGREARDQSEVGNSEERDKGATTIAVTPQAPTFTETSGPPTGWRIERLN